MMKTNIQTVVVASLLFSSFAVAQSPNAAKKPSGTVKVPITQVKVSALTLIKPVAPAYPPEAKSQGIQGSVSLHVVVGADGAVKEATVLSGPAALTQAALDAVRQWRYKPYLLNGTPVEVESTAVINFNLTVEEPLPWWVVVAEVAKGTPSSQIIAELKQREVDFPENSPLDALNEELLRSLGASDELVEAARHAQIYPSMEYANSEKTQLASVEPDIRNLLSKSPQNGSLHELLAMILWHRAPTNDEATQELRKALLDAPDSPSAHYYLGISLVESATTPQIAEEAIYNFRESLRLLPDQFESHRGLGFALQFRKDLEGALGEFLKAFDFPMSPIERADINEHIGDLYLAQKKYDLAASEYRDALDHATEKAHLHLSIGIAEYQKGDYRNALVEFRKYMWLRKGPNNGAGGSWLAATLYHLGQYSESISQAKATMAENPNDKATVDGAKTWLDGATAQLQASGSDGPQQAQQVVVVQASNGGGGGGLAGTTWACTTEFFGSTASYLRTFNAGGRLEDSNVRESSADTNDTIANSVWEQNGTQLAIRDQRSGEDWWRGTVSGNSITGGSLKHACPDCTDLVSTGDSVTCTLQSGAIQSNSVAAVNAGPPPSYFTSPTIQSSGSSSNTTRTGSGSSSTTANSSGTDSTSAKSQNDPRGNQADGNDYTDTASQCGHAQIEANTLYIVNECGFQVDATYTSQGDIWGETPLAPGEHHRTAYSAAAVNNVGGVSVYTCPGSGTAVDVSGNPIGLNPHTTDNVYRCHR